MSRLKETLVICLLVLTVFGLTSLTNSKAFTQSNTQPAPSSGEQTLQALLSEVHQLRVTMQRANLNTYHAQITIERLKLQQQRVDRLTAQLGDVRKQLAETRKTFSQNSDNMKSFERKLAKETDAPERARLEASIQSWKAELEELNQKEQQEQAYETQLNAQLQLEQAKLAELSDRLDTLQRELETQMATDKPKTSDKRPN